MINGCLLKLHVCAKYLGAHSMASGWNVEKGGEKRTLFFVQKKDSLSILQRTSWMLPG